MAAAFAPLQRIREKLATLLVIAAGDGTPVIPGPRSGTRNP